jgi:hypothetical protein
MGPGLLEQVVRFVQPTELSGYEAHPCEFAERMLAISVRRGASGGGARVVGVYPWELGVFDLRVRHEVRAADRDGRLRCTSFGG